MVEIKNFTKKKWLAEHESGMARMFPFIYGMFILGWSQPVNSNTDPICIVAIKQMINSMHVMISRFMSNHDGDAVVDGRFVKFFCRVATDLLKNIMDV